MCMKNEQRTEPASSSRGYSRYTRKLGNNWRKVKHNIELGMTSTWLIISSRLETRYGFTSPRRLKGERKKLNPIHYGPFTILEKSGTNDFRMDIQPYMQIYSIVNVENLKIF